MTTRVGAARPAIGALGDGPPEGWAPLALGEGVAWATSLGDAVGAAPLAGVARVSRPAARRTTPAAVMTAETRRWRSGRAWRIEARC